MFSLLCAKAFDSSALTFSRFAGPVERIVDRGSPSQNIRLPFEVKPIEFVPGPDDNGSLVSVGGGVPGNPAFEGEVVLHPVPFSAAKGVSLWSGQSVSTNVGADEKLDEKLQKLTADLRRPGMTNWSFSSQRLPKAGWTAASPYQPTNVRPQYFGLLPEPSAVF